MIIKPDRVTFGWGAPPFASQFPTLSQNDAEHFDKDNEAIIRLHLRGMLTDSQRDAAIEKCKKKILKALVAAECPARPEVRL